MSEERSINFDDIDVNVYQRLLSDNNQQDVFSELTLSDSVLDNDGLELSSLFNQYTTQGSYDQSIDLPQHPVFPSDELAHIPSSQADNRAILANSNIDEDDFFQNLNYDVHEEIVTQQNANEILEQPSSSNNEDPFGSISGEMFVKVQPKADQRARYQSDGLRYLPDARNNPMAVQLPDLSSKLCQENETYGVIATMVTSDKNPRRQTFVHVNDAKYNTKDAVELDHGGIFIPINDIEKKNCEKKFPKYSIICKKVDKYTFELTLFNPLNGDSTTEKYTLPYEHNITKAAKGKQFAMDYDLLCYKIVFQLAFKRDEQISVSNIRCETNIVNEQKAPTTGKKRKSSSNNKISWEGKDSITLPVITASKKFKPLAPPFTELPVVRKSDRIAKRSFADSS